MKLFFEEYGIATMLAIASLSLVTMTTPVGAAISDGLNTAIEQTGPESDQVKELNNKADKSVRALAGEDVTYEPEVLGFYVPVDYLKQEGKCSSFTTICRVANRDDVTKYGIIYAKTDSAGEINQDTMKLGSSNTYIVNLEQNADENTDFNPSLVSLHKTNTSFTKEGSLLAGFTYTNSTFKYEELQTKYSVRAYCKTSDNKVYYSSNIYTTTLEDIAKDMYYNKTSLNEEEHKYIYKNILLPISAKTNMAKIAQNILTKFKNDGVPTAKGSDAYNFANNLYKDLGRYAICSQGYVWDNRSSDKTFTHQDENYFTSITLGRESDTNSDAYRLLGMLNAISTNKRSDYSTIFEWIVNEVPESTGLASLVEW